MNSKILTEPLVNGLTVQFVQICFRPVSNRGPFACEANVITTTLRKPNEWNTKGVADFGGVGHLSFSEPIEDLILLSPLIKQ